jgi:hypothetical protein
MANETHILNIVANLRDNVSKVAVGLNKNIEALKENTAKLVGSNEQLEASTRKVTKAEEDLLRKRNIQEGQIKRLNGEIEKENKILQDSKRSAEDKAKATERLERRQRELAAETKRLTSTSRNLNREVTRNTSAIDMFGQRMRAVRETVRQTGREVDGQSSAWKRFAFSQREAEQESSALERRLARLGRSMLGLAIASVIVFMQSFASSLTAVAGQAVALAGSLTYAASVVGGVFVGAIAQAIPVVGLFAATLQRLTIIQDAVNQHNLLQKQSSQEAASGMEQQTESTNAVKEANEGLREAQDDLNEARRLGKRELEDLLAAEREAELQFERSAIAQRDAKFALEDAIQGGDVTGIRSAQLDLAEARLGRSGARTDLQRAREDRRRIGGNINNLESVRNATEGVRDATERLAEAHREAGVAAQDQSAAESSLDFFLKQLTPTERKLYNTIIRLQENVREAFTPITDNLVGSINLALRRVERLLTDPAIVRGFTELSEQMSRMIDHFSNLFTNNRTRDFFVEMLEQSARNLRPIERIMTNVFRIFRNISLAVAPILHDLLKDIAGVTKRWAEEDVSTLRDFFREGARHLDAWVDLLGAAVSLWGELMGASGDSALATITDFTERLNDATNALREDDSAASEFFMETSEALGYLIDIVVTFGEAMIEAFDPEAVKALSVILDEAIIPGLALAVVWLGELIQLTDDLVDIEIFGISFGEIIAVALAIRLVHGSLGLISSLLLGGGLLGSLRRLAGALTVVYEAIRAFGIGGAIHYGILKLKDFFGVLGGGLVGSWFTKLKNGLRNGAGKLRDVVRSVLTRAFAAVQFVSTLAIEAASGLIAGIGRYVSRNMGKIRAIGRTIGRGLIVGILLALPFIVEDVWELGKELGEKVSDKWGDVGYDIGYALGEGLRTALNEVIIPVLNFFVDRANNLLNSIDFALPGEQFGEIEHIDPIIDPKVQKLANEGITASSKAIDELTQANIKHNESAKATIKMTEGQISVQEQQERTFKDINKQFEAGTLELGNFTDQTKKATRESDRFSDKTKDTRKEQDKQAGSANRLSRQIGRLANNFFGTGKQSSELGRVVRDVTNKVLKSFGVQEIKFDIPTAAKVAGDLAGGGLGGLVGSIGGAIGNLAGGQTGGYFGDPSQRGPDDRLIKVAGGEAILTGWQQQYVNTAMALAGAGAGLPYRNLDQLFRGDQRTHASAPAYAKGGIVPAGGFPDADGSLPGLDALAWFLEKKFGLQLVDGSRPAGTPTSTGGISDHSWGGAIDVSNGITTPQMDAANEYLRKTIGGGGDFSTNYSGGMIKQMLYRTMTGGDHFNHIHVALLESYARNAAAVIKALTGGKISGALGGLGGDSIKKFKIKGPDGPLKKQLQAQADKMVKAANKKIGKETMTLDMSGLGAGAHQGVLSEAQVKKIFLAAFKITGVSPGGGNLADLMNLAMEESSWNPGAENRTPAGMAAGLPQGILQVTVDTFNAYKLKKYPDPFNPLHNAIASIRYQMATYGDIQRNAPYARGGMVPHFDDGGVVPGRRGSPQFIMAHGGETILPTHKFDTGGRVPSNPAALVDYNFEQIRDAGFALSRMDFSKFDQVVKALTALLREGGPFDDLAASIESLTTYLAEETARWTYKIRKGVVSQVRTSLQIANRNLDDLEAIGAELEDTMDALRESLAFTRERIKEINKELKREENKKKRGELQDQRDELRTILANIRLRISEIDSQIISNLQERFEAIRAIFDAKVARFDAKLTRNELLRQIQEATNQLNTPAGEDPNNANLEPFLQQRGNILRQEQRFFERQLEKFRRRGNREGVREMQQALLENKLAQIENTQAIKDLSTVVEEQVAEIFDFNSTAWQIWRQAVLNGMGGVLPQYQIPSLQTGGLVTRDGLVNLHAGEVVTPAGGAGDYHINITEPMEVADPVALSSAIAWRLKHSK